MYHLLVCVYAVCVYIYAAGRLSACPGYVGLTLNSREDSELLLRHDLLVQCPAQFNVSIQLANWQQRTDKTFDLQLTDARQTHRVFLAVKPCSRLSAAHGHRVFLTHLTFDPITHRQFPATNHHQLTYSFISPKQHYGTFN